MPCLTRCLLRWGLIGGLALGGATLFLGPDRVMAGFDMLRSKAEYALNDFVDDPVALRRQLQELADAYPDRIAEVHGELAEVDRQIANIERDTEISRRVVANTTDDLRDLRDMLAQADEHAARGVPVAIRNHGVRLDVEGARSEARRIAEVRTSFENRQAGNAQQLTFLGEQRQRLADILGKLQDEYDTFEVKLAQIDRQIDAIERNERLIEMTREQKAILADYEKFGKVGNLSQLESKLVQLQAIQDAQLESLARSGFRHDYEREAVNQINGVEGQSGDPFAGLDLEVPEDGDAEPAPSSTRDIAYADAIVIDTPRR